MSLQDKETAHLKIDPNKYREGYDRIFNKKNKESKKKQSQPLICPHWARERIDELENLLNESQTARREQQIEISRLKKLELELIKIQEMTR